MVHHTAINQQADLPLSSLKKNLINEGFGKNSSHHRSLALQKTSSHRKLSLERSSSHRRVLIIMQRNSSSEHHNDNSDSDDETASVTSNATETSSSVSHADPRLPEAAACVSRALKRICSQRSIQGLLDTEEVDACDKLGQSMSTEAEADLPREELLALRIKVVLSGMHSLQEQLRARIEINDKKAQARFSSRNSIGALLCKKKTQSLHHQLQAASQASEDLQKLASESAGCIPKESSGSQSSPLMFVLSRHNRNFFQSHHHQRPNLTTALQQLRQGQDAERSSCLAYSPLIPILLLDGLQHKDIIERVLAHYLAVAVERPSSCFSKSTSHATQDSFPARRRGAICAKNLDELLQL